MVEPSSTRTSSSIRESVFDRIRHLDLSDRITHRSAAVAGHGGLSEVFKGRCRLSDGEEASVAIKRLRYHLEDLDMNKVRLFTVARPFLVINNHLSSSSNKRYTSGLDSGIRTF